MLGVRLLQIILIMAIVGVIIYLLRLSYALKLEKRIAKFSITSKNYHSHSIFDNILNYLWRIVNKFSHILTKSVVLSKWATKYNKYIDYEERNKKSGMSYISFKILLSLFVLILSLITCLFHKVNFNIMFFLSLFLITFFIPDIFLHLSYNRKRKKVEDDLLKAIIIMNNAFQSGRNIMQAIEVVKNELDGPIQDEFKKIYLDMTYGLSIDTVFERFYERVKLEDAKYITSSLTLLNKTGGDIIKVFALIEKSFFDKKNLKNELNSLTATSRFMFKLLIFLPFIFILLIYVLNPTYFNPLFTTPFGLIVLIFTILLYVLYILVVKKVLEVDL